MQYLMMLYIDEQSLSEEARGQCYQESAAYAQELHRAGKYVLAAPLYPTSTATSMRVRGSECLVTDGPFAETREQFGGFFLVEAKDLDDAMAIAARIPGAKFGTVEIRPVIQVPNLPENISTGPVETSPARAI